MVQRLLIGTLVFGLSGCAVKPLDQDQARRNLKAQADEVARAMLQENHSRMADLTHPALVEKLGGRAKYIERLNEIAAEMKGQGFRFNNFVLSEPSELVESSGDVYATVPFKLELSAPGGIVGVQPSYLIGVSKDRGANWTFLDGNGVAGDREKLKLVLPQFPDSLSVPDKQPPTWGAK